MRAKLFKYAIIQVIDNHDHILMYVVTARLLNLGRFIVLLMFSIFERYGFLIALTVSIFERKRQIGPVWCMVTFDHRIKFHSNAG